MKMILFVIVIAAVIRMTQIISIAFVMQMTPVLILLL
jgi:hypothetical protein